MPGEFDDIVTCEVSAQSLSCHPEYDAISYTWADESGDDTKCRTVTIAGKPFQVLRNCEMALRRAREATPSSKAILRKLMANDSGLSWVGSEELWADLLSRRYFNRIWILQEVALARKATLICGEESIPWRLMRPENLQLKLPPPVYKHLSRLLLPPVFHFDYKTYTSPDQLLNLLDLGQICEAKDARDKVFALLGLLPAGRIGTLRADYSLSVGQVFTHVALHCASTVGWGSVPSRAGLENREGSLLKSLPFWVTDWSVARRIEAPAGPVKQSSPSEWETTKYNQAPNTVSLKMIKTPGGGTQWYAWEENIAKLSSKYLCFRESGTFHGVALKRYHEFADAYDHR
ncbi:hypothetical protein BJ170DRAFT_687350 [Xylariales sp. AK1849]|nr:hypothetical protein BJ170DRAFT_687350 [Xylariales sp. AK1849]